MHEVCVRAAKPGATTADSTASARDGDRPARRPLQLPRLPRVPRGGVHVAQRRDRARHPERRRRAARRATSSRSTAGRSSRAGTPTPRSPCRSARSTTSRQRLIEVTRRSLEAAIDAGGRRATASATSAPRSRASPSRPGSRSCASTSGHGIGTAMHEDPQVPNYGPAGRGMKLKDGHVLAIEPMVNVGGPPRPRCSTTAGPSSPPTAAAPPTSSTPSPSPTTAPRSSRFPGDAAPMPPLGS